MFSGVTIKIREKDYFGQWQWRQLADHEFTVSDTGTVHFTNTLTKPQITQAAHPYFNKAGDTKTTKPKRARGVKNELSKRGY